MCFSFFLCLISLVWFILTPENLQFLPPLSPPAVKHYRTLSLKCTILIGCWLGRCCSLTEQFVLPVIAFLFKCFNKAGGENHQEAYGQWYKLEVGFVNTVTVMSSWVIFTAVGSCTSTHPQVFHHSVGGNANFLVLLSFTFFNWKSDKEANLY